MFARVIIIRGSIRMRCMTILVDILGNMCRLRAAFRWKTWIHDVLEMVKSCYPCSFNVEGDSMICLFWCYLGICIAWGTWIKPKTKEQLFWVWTCCLFLSLNMLIVLWINISYVSMLWQLFGFKFCTHIIFHVCSSPIILATGYIYKNNNVLTYMWEDVVDAKPIEVNYR